MAANPVMTMSAMPRRAMPRRATPRRATPQTKKKLNPNRTKIRKNHSQKLMDGRTRRNQKKR